jgi:hypothetical protein
MDPHFGDTRARKYKKEQKIRKKSYFFNFEVDFFKNYVQTVNETF